MLVTAAWPGAPPAESPDDGLLEFLGSVDSEDKDWHDYLARTDIDQVARHAGGAAKDPPAANVPPRLKPVPPKADAPPSAPPSDPPADAGSKVVPP